LDVKGVLRGGGTDSELGDVIREKVRRKWIGHEIHSGKFVAPPRPMYSIGG
jgi:cyclic pyranopterin phosphate synthase